MQENFKKIQKIELPDGSSTHEQEQVTEIKPYAIIQEKNKLD
jgi:hypothetical protein